MASPSPNFSGQRSHRAPRIANSKSTHASVSVGLDKQEWNQMPVPQSVATNNQLAIVANRFNYSFNLKGAALSIVELRKCSQDKSRRVEISKASRTNSRLRCGQVEAMPVTLLAPLRWW